MADEKDKTLWVRAITGLNHNGRVGEHQVLLFETDDAHPTGEAFIAGPIPVEVGNTTAVEVLLRDKKIEKVSAAEAKAAQPGGGGSAGDLSAREQALVAREKAVADQEKDLATQRADLAKRTPPPGSGQGPTT